MPGSTAAADRNIGCAHRDRAPVALASVTLLRRNLGRTGLAVVLALTVGVVCLGCSGAGAGAKNPKTSVVGSAPGAFDGLKTSPVKLFDGSGAYREVRFTVSPPKSAPGRKAKGVFEGCALLALNAAEHAQGMMRRTDFAGYDAMIFHFVAPSDGGFWMKTVPMDLSIGWTDASGAVVAASFMKREGNCENCPIYSPSATYRTAVEVPPRGLARVGLDRVGDGSVLAYGGRCSKSPKAG